MTRLTTCVDDESLAERAAADVARYLTRTREERGVAHLALSGGTTPRRTYELLAARSAELSGVEIWFADERCVAPDDEQSNYRLVAESLLAPADIPEERVHRMEGELGPDEGARRYARALCDGVNHGEGQLPVLDLIVLGIGPDGHVASLFPGSPALDAGEDAVSLGVRDSPKPPPERITLSLAVLRAARRCLLVATGAGKADAIDAMLGEPSPHVPASLLRRERLTVIVDDAAAPRGPRP
ncbi:MAG TPA: 6-phosphogluconolactonase [Solirubrobacteraceae bacterium]|jgi:6-phosphogluconolactonase|nr:6-phosphogluconolactonase [Solirubrobacteraceae bacterium]